MSEREVDYHHDQSTNFLILEHDQLVGNENVVISDIGQELLSIKSNLFNEVDTCMGYFRMLEKEKSSFVGKGCHGLGIILNSGLSMHYRWPGNQGILFRMIDPSLPETYVVKMRTFNHRAQCLYDISQSLATEAILTQCMQRDLGDSLAELGFRMRSFAFASDMVACYPFINGHTMNYEDLFFISKFEKLRHIVEPYVAEQKLKVPLWNEVDLDLYDYRYRIRDENFVQSADGMITWIDPFVSAD